MGILNFSVIGFVSFRPLPREEPRLARRVSLSANSAVPRSPLAMGSKASTLLREEEIEEIKKETGCELEIHDCVT